MIKWLLTLVLALLVLGLLSPLLTRLGVGRLPGDIHIKRARGSLHFPFTSVILMSLLLTLIVHLFGR